MIYIDKEKQKYIEKKLDMLSHSKFRGSFHLRKYMISYIDEKGMGIIARHAMDFIKKNLAPANLINDGKQTPTKGHPVFVAQHACACCCRGCLEKWHGIPKGRHLYRWEVNYVFVLLMTWIKHEYDNAKS